MNNKIEAGNKFWCNDKGQLHREDGPAIVWEDGSKEWWINDELHRLDGPAIEYSNGTKCWYINGKRHRVDGPAIEYSDGKKEWYINDNQIDCKNNEEFLRNFPHRMMGLTD
jgi:hypothetical protein